MRSLPARTQAGIIRYWNRGIAPQDPTTLHAIVHDVQRTGWSPWSWLRELRQLELIGAKRLDRKHLNDTFSRFNYDNRTLPDVCRRRRTRRGIQFHF